MDWVAYLSKQPMVNPQPFYCGASSSSNPPVKPGDSFKVGNTRHSYEFLHKMFTLGKYLYEEIDSGFCGLKGYGELTFLRELSHSLYSCSPLRGDRAHCSWWGFLAKLRESIKSTLTTASIECALIISALRFYKE